MEDWDDTLPHAPFTTASSRSSSQRSSKVISLRSTIELMQRSSFETVQLTHPLETVQQSHHTEDVLKTPPKRSFASRVSNYFSSSKESQHMTANSGSIRADSPVAGKRLAKKPKLTVEKPSMSQATSSSSSRSSPTMAVDASITPRSPLSANDECKKTKKRRAIPIVTRSEAIIARKVFTEVSVGEISAAFGIPRTSVYPRTNKVVELGRACKNKCTNSFRTRNNKDEDSIENLIKTLQDLASHYLSNQGCSEYLDDPRKIVEFGAALLEELMVRAEANLKLQNQGQAMRIPKGSLYEEFTREWIAKAASTTTLLDMDLQ
ncbi:hypothetical protein BGX27_007495 [Mortierella sp. AM989]|nr:hypothetical protein BGX27_007495 [Mortierella sp. AM989]